MNEFKSGLIVFAFSLVPYVLVSWAFAEIADGNSKNFWTVFGVLVGVRTFFALIEMLGGVLSWRLHGKHRMVKWMLSVFQTNEFPPRFYSDDPLSNYLARIENGEEISSSVKTAAKQLEFMFEVFEGMGMLAGLRIYSAAEVALEIYSPRSAAREYSSDIDE